MCLIVACYAGDHDTGREVVRPLLDFGPPVGHHLGPIPYPALQGAFDALFPPGLQHYWKAEFVKELSDEVIDVHLTYGPRVPHVSSAVHLYPIDGAAGRVAPGDTAFSYRDARFATVIAAMYPDPGDTPANVAWVRDYHSALSAHSAGGAYVNFLMEEGQERVTASYRDNYQRLVEVKSAYDPTNLFRMNQNIRPRS
jgi:FAD/FMN-containing dehydrogenase